jgi:hypothetical protein
MKTLLAMILLVATFAAQTANTDRLLKQHEQEITGKLRWHVMWDLWPAGFRVSGREARLAVAVTPQSMYFCSRNLHGCMQYEIRFGHVGRDLRAKVLEGQQSEMDAVLQWMRENGEAVLPTPAPGSPRVLRGVPNSSPTFWTMDVKLPTQTELIEEYKQLRATPELADLRAWLVTEHRNTDYKSITIACFAPTDDFVFVYGERKTLGPIMLSLFHDIELGWTVAAFSDRPEEAKYIASMRDRIQKIECGRITF